MTVVRAVRNEIHGPVLLIDPLGLVQHDTQAATPLSAFFQPK